MGSVMTWVEGLKRGDLTVMKMPVSLENNQDVFKKAVVIKYVYQQAMKLQSDALMT